MNPIGYIIKLDFIGIVICWSLRLHKYEGPMSVRCFLFCGGLLHDAMHDILEGIASHHIKRLLFHAIKSIIFTQKDFNERLVNFNYGYAEKDKPIPIINIL